MRAKKNHFTAAEDQEIIEGMQRLGIKEGVKVLSRNLGRSRRSIKERYMNTLNPSLQPVFTEEEDVRLLKAVKDYGTSWKNIEKLYKDKSQSQLKSRYLTLLRLIKKEDVSKDGYRKTTYRERKYNIRRAKDELFMNSSMFQFNLPNIVFENINFGQESNENSFAGMDSFFTSELLIDVSFDKK